MALSSSRSWQLPLSPSNLAHGCGTKRETQRPVEAMDGGTRLAWLCHQRGVADPSDHSHTGDAQGVLLIILSKEWIKINYKKEIKRWML